MLSTFSNLCLSFLLKGRTIDADMLRRLGFGSWTISKYFFLHRNPAFELKLGSLRVLWKFLKQKRFLVATFNTDAYVFTDKKKGIYVFESYLFVAKKQNYGISKLSYNGRRDARRGRKNFVFQELRKDAFFSDGLLPYCDTRQRVGLDDNTAKDFQKRFEIFLKDSSCRIFGAYKENKLVSFISCIFHPNSVEIEGSFSLSDVAYKRDCPNDGLFSWFLEHCFSEEGVDFVSIGLSSIGSDSGDDSLNSFKVKAGFEAIPVKRVFLLHPVVTRLVDSLCFKKVFGWMDYFFPRKKIVQNIKALLER